MSELLALALSKRLSTQNHLHLDTFPPTQFHGDPTDMNVHPTFELIQ